MRRAELLVSAAAGLPAISPDAIRTEVAYGQGVYDINMIPSFVDETSSTRTANYLHHYTTIQLHFTHSCNHLSFGIFQLFLPVYISLKYELPLAVGKYTVDIDFKETFRCTVG